MQWYKGFLILVMVLCTQLAHADAIVVRAANNVVLDAISQHKQNYVLPITYRKGQGKAKNSDLIFQFSAKINVFVPDLYLAYTQRSYWSFLKTDDSSPFRETNYNPEIFYDLKLSNWTHYKNIGALIGFEHESNGKSLPTSRSWDRFYIWPYWQTHHGEYSAKIWVRRPEDKKTSPTDTDGDDNPDILDYMGYGELYYYNKSDEGQGFSAMVRLNPATERGAVQLDYSWPLANKNMFVFTRIFSGYGESLIDYNDSITRFSLGLEFR